MKQDPTTMEPAPSQAVCPAEGTLKEPAPTPSPSDVSWLHQYWKAVVSSPISLVPLFLLAFVGGVLLWASELHNFGTSFWGTYWNWIPPGPGSSYGIGYFALGSVLTAGLAILLATILSLAMAISIVVYLPPIASRVLTLFTDLLAGIPSVVFGIWGFVILAPYFGRTLEPSLRDALFWIPGFGGPEYAIGGGTGILLAVFVLTIMVIPITTAVMRESLRAVPHSAVEAGLALGATRWEVVRRVRMPMARQGISGALFLGFGRAIGESVAVAMLIGATPQLPPSLYAGGYTIASYILDQQDSAFVYPILLQVLVEFALVLLLITLAVNLVGHWLTRDQRSPGRRGLFS